MWKKGLHVHVIVIHVSNIKTAICRLKRRFGKTSLLEWRLNIINTSDSKFWDCTKQFYDLYKFIVDTTRKFCPRFLTSTGRA